jgi:hypothetical protein
MKTTGLIVVAALMTMLVTTQAGAQTESEPQVDPLKERLGVRVGWGWTPNHLSDAFGGGLYLSLHFIQRIKKPFGVDVNLGAIYLGKTDKDIRLPDFTTEAFDKVSMRIFMLTAAPMVEFSTSDRTSCFVSAGGGFYAATLLLDQTIYQYDLTNDYFGVTVNAGVMHRIFTNWFLDLSLHLDKFWTPDNPTTVHWVYLFSDGDNSPLFWSITGGVALRLF